MRTRSAQPAFFFGCGLTWRPGAWHTWGMATNLDTCSAWTAMADGAFASTKPPRRSINNLQPPAVAYCLTDRTLEIWRENDLLYRREPTEEGAWVDPWCDTATTLDIARFEEYDLDPVLASMIPGDTCDLDVYLCGGSPRG